MLLGGLLAAPLLPAPAQTPGLRRDRDRLFVPATVAGRPFEALLDSGAQLSVLDVAVAARLGITGGAPVNGVGTGGSFRATLARAVPYSVAGIALGPRRLVLADLSELAGRLIGRPLALIAGRELFDSGRFSLDTLAPSLARTARTAPPPGTPLPLTAQRGIETVRAGIEGLPVQAELDIGNGNEVLVHARIARRLGWLTDGREVTTVGGAGGLGGAVNRRLTIARTLTLAGRTFENVPVGLDDQPTGADANLPTRLLDAFRLTLDFPQRRVWLAPR